jgi:hypothetical protein
MSWNTPAGDSATDQALRIQSSLGSAGGLSMSDLVVGSSSSAACEVSSSNGAAKAQAGSSSIGNGMVVVASLCPLSCMAHYANVLVVGGESGHVSAGVFDCVLKFVEKCDPLNVLAVNLPEAGEAEQKRRAEGAVSLKGLESILPTRFEQLRQVR